jgi:hypothetical protein
MFPVQPRAEDELFLELRRKVRRAELLSAAMEKLLRAVQFSGRISIVVQNGRVLKSGYEEGYFSHRHDERLLGGAAAAQNP